MDDVLRLPALEQARLIHEGKVSSLELIDASIARIERLDARVNAVVARRFEEARAEAGQARPEAPFAGVPLLMKDCGGEVAGMRHTEGCSMLRDHVSPQDGELTKRLRAAGFIILGKTNAPEFGVMPTTEPKLHGPTRNPWDPMRTPGGSSGGAATAVALRYVAVAHGNDGGGSIRIPASCCGVFGLKPSRGRNPSGSAAYEGDLLSVDHALTVTVADSAAVLDAVCGTGRTIYGELAKPRLPFIEMASKVPRPLSIGFTRQTPRGDPVHPEAAEAVMDAARLCESLGHHVEETSPIYDGRRTNGAFVTLWGASAASTIDYWSRIAGCDPDEANFERDTWAVAEIGRRRTAAHHARALTAMNDVVRAFDAFFRRHDLWLTPATGEPPPLLGTMAPADDDPLAGFTRSGAFTPFTSVANATGCPAMSVPLYWTPGGLPIGAHFVASYGDEGRLLALATQLEGARPWAGRRPPLGRD